MPKPNPNAATPAVPPCAVPPCSGPLDTECLDFNTTAGLGTLKQRSEILRRIREFFYQRGFWEVETPLLSQETVIDLYLEPLEVPLLGHPPSTGFLQTSPEFGMKRLLAAGAEAIFQICKAFRHGEVGRHHNPEFTMLEWYRCGDSYRQGRALLAELIETWLPGPTVEWTYREAFLRLADLDPFEMSDHELRERAAARGFQVEVPAAETPDPHGLGRRQALNFLWSEWVEPHLGRESPTIVYDWPAAEAALAQTTTQTLPDGRTVEIAERFELYVRGVELANGYHELLSADVLAERNRRTNAARVASGLRTLPDNRRLLAAMRQGIPACCGVALGVDRLVMLLTDQATIQAVIPFPWDRA